MHFLMQRQYPQFVLILWPDRVGRIEVIMKTMFLTFLAILAIGAVALARNPETIVLKSGQQKPAAKGEITVKFVSVTEDSRCPADANCIWAGNATVQVKITSRNGGSKMSVMNTTTGPTGDQFNGWAIYLTSLTPSPNSRKALDPKKYVATFEIKRLTR